MSLHLQPELLTKRGALNRVCLRLAFHTAAALMPSCEHSSCPCFAIFQRCKVDTPLRLEAGRFK